MSVAEQTSPADLPAYPAVGLIRLLLVMLYDAFIVFAILMIVGAIALKLPFNRQVAGKDFAYTLYLLSAWFLYLGWCWRNGGMTLGMRAWKVRLINIRANAAGNGADQNPDCLPPAWWQCGLRFAGGFVSALTAGAGYWWILFDRQRLSWHDRLSGTRLLHVKVTTRLELNSTTQEVDGANSQ